MRGRLLHGRARSPQGWHLPPRPGRAGQTPALLSSAETQRRPGSDADRLSPGGLASGDGGAGPRRPGSDLSAST